MKIKTVWINPLLRIDSLPPTVFSQQHPLITPPFLGPGEKYLQPPSSFYLFWNQVALHKVSSPWFLYPPPEGYKKNTHKLVSKKRGYPWRSASLPPLTMEWKMDPWKMIFLWIKWGYSICYVSLQEGIYYTLEVKQHSKNAKLPYLEDVANPE